MTRYRVTCETPSGSIETFPDTTEEAMSLARSFFLGNAQQCVITIETPKGTRVIRCVDGRAVKV